MSHFLRRRRAIRDAFGPARAPAPTPSGAVPGEPPRRVEHGAPGGGDGETRDRRAAFWRYLRLLLEITAGR